MSCLETFIDNPLCVAKLRNSGRDISCFSSHYSYACPRVFGDRTEHPLQATTMTIWQRLHPFEPPEAFAQGVVHKVSHPHPNPACHPHPSTHSPSPLLRTPCYQRICLKPVVGENIGLRPYNSPPVRDSGFLISAFPIHSSSFFPMLFKHKMVRVTNR